MKYSFSDHCVFNLKAHIIFVVAYKRKAILGVLWHEWEKFSRRYVVNTEQSLANFSASRIMSIFLLSFLRLLVSQTWFELWNQYLRKKLEESLIRKFGNISGESDFGQGVTVLFPWETEQRQRQLSATSKVKNDLHHNLPLSIRGLTTAEFRAFC